MRDAARERTDAFHLLHLAELAFELLALGDVFAQYQQVRDLPRRVAQATHLHRLPDDTALGNLPADLTAPFLTGAHAHAEFIIGRLAGMAFAKDVVFPVEDRFERQAG